MTARTLRTLSGPRNWCRSGFKDLDRLFVVVAGLSDARPHGIPHRLIQERGDALSAEIYRPKCQTKQVAGRNVGPGIARRERAPDFLSYHPPYAKEGTLCWRFQGV
jgi:hypothetical protein